MVHTHTPKPVYEQEDVRVLWHQALNTDREVTANRPGIIIKNNNENTRMQIYAAIPADRSVLQKEAQRSKL